MKQIIGDDYPTYEDSVKLTLAERDIAKSNSDRLLKENFEVLDWMIPAPAQGIVGIASLEKNTSLNHLETRKKIIFNLLMK